MRALARVTAYGRGQLVMTYTQNDSIESISAREIQLRSTGGCVSIKSLGDNAVTDIDSDVINLSADRAYLGLLATDGGGGISLLTQGDESCIQLNTPGGGTGTPLTPQGFVLASGPSSAMGVMQVQEGQMTLSMGNLISTSILSLKPDSIILKVGLAP